MSVEHRREAHVVPLVADGNPTSCWAAMNLCQDSGIEAVGYNVRYSAKMAGWIHDMMTRDPERAERYTEESDERRLDRSAMLFSRVSAAEFRTMALLEGYSDGFDLASFYQEYPLLGLEPETVDRMGIDAVRLVVPDSFPKVSGIEAVIKHGKKASFAVWNTGAQEELQALGLEAKLVAPFILDGLRPDDEDFDITGDQIVVKSSGSGMPKQWWNAIRNGLEKTADSDVRWSMHGKKALLSSYADPRSSHGRSRRILSFYRALGANTEVMVCYNSEQTGVAFEMWQRGVPVNIVVLPVRGSHEDRNLSLAMEAGIVAAQLDLDGIKPTPGLTKVKPEGLIDMLEGQGRKSSAGFDFIGKNPIYDEPVALSTASDLAT